MPGGMEEIPETVNATGTGGNIAATATIATTEVGVRAIRVRIRPEAIHKPYWIWWYGS
jgi:hypothetical protein